MNYIKMKAPLNPPMGDFFRMSLCNVSLLPLYFSSDFSIRVLTCIIQHGQKANRVKMNGCAALSSLQGWCIYHARKPPKDREPGRKKYSRKEKENAHFYIRKIKSIPPQKQAPEGFLEN